MALQSSSTSRDNIAAGTTGQRPSGEKGMIRYNSTTGCLEYYNGSSWVCSLRVEDINNGTLNLKAGGGITVSGTNPTANQSNNTTRTVVVDEAWMNNRYTTVTATKDPINCAICNFRIMSGSITELQTKNISAIQRQGKGRYRVLFSGGAGITNSKYSVIVNWVGAPNLSDYSVKVDTGGSTASGNLHYWTSSGFDIGLGGERDGNPKPVDGCGKVNISVVR